MTTPEGKIKAKVRDILKQYNVYYLQPVQTGYGAAGLDFHCVVRWKNIPLAFFIETKDRGKIPSERQTYFIEERKQNQNANTFIIDGDTGLARLERWLQQLQENIPFRQSSMIITSQQETI